MKPGNLPEWLPEMSGKTVLVTGANSGLGLETTRGLAAAGAEVVMACRSLDKAQTAVEDIRGDVPQAKLEVMQLNLADLSSIKRFAGDFAAKHAKLDVLVNNAGVMALPERRTTDGFEMQVGTNHLGHFALTGYLLDLLRKTPNSRVITVSSLVHRMGEVDLADLNWEARSYDKWRAYFQSKLANLMFALELHRRLSKAGNGTLSAAAHPGYAATHLQYAGPEMSGSGLKKAGMALANALFAQSQAAGALPSIYAAAAEDVQSGDFIGPDGFREMWGQPKKVQPAGRAKKEDVAEKLWTLSQELTGVSYL